jgi:hypothetical protein
MLRRLQIQFALWLLRRNIPRQSETKPFQSCGLLTGNPDPCIEQKNAKIESGLDVVRKYQAFEDAMTLDMQRALLLIECLTEHAGGGSEGGGPVGP